MCQIFAWLKTQDNPFPIRVTIVRSACALSAEYGEINGPCIRIKGDGADKEDPGHYDFAVYEREFSKVCARYFGLKASGRAWNQTSSYNDGAGQDSWNWGKKAPLQANPRRHAPAVAHVIHAIATESKLTCDCVSKPLYKTAACV
jgi:hypothetical protein